MCVWGEKTHLPVDTSGTRSCSVWPRDRSGGWSSSSQRWQPGAEQGQEDTAGAEQERSRGRAGAGAGEKEQRSTTLIIYTVAANFSNAWCLHWRSSSRSCTSRTSSNEDPSPTPLPPPSSTHPSSPPQTHTLTSYHTLSLPVSLHFLSPLTQCLREFYLTYSIIKLNTF